MLHFASNRQGAHVPYEHWLDRSAVTIQLNVRNPAFGSPMDSGSLFPPTVQIGLHPDRTHCVDVAKKALAAAWKGLLTMRCKYVCVGVDRVLLMHMRTSGRVDEWRLRFRLVRLIRTGFPRLGAPDTRDWASTPANRFTPTISAPTPCAPFQN